MTEATEYRSPLLSLAGAAPANPDDPATAGLDATGVAWHYGDPLAEQRALERGPVWVDRSQRAVLRVTGDDAAAFLNSLLSQKLDDAAPGFSAEALDLDAQGHVAHHVFVTRSGEDFYLDLPGGLAGSLRDYLSRMVFWSKVEVAETDLGVVTVLGELEWPLQADTSAEGRDAAGGADLGTGVVAARQVDWPGQRRLDLLVKRTELGRVAAELSRAGVTPSGLMAFTAQRIKALEPEQPADLDSRTIAHEVPHWIGRHGRLGAVHLDKGCYRGQETVARVENIGRSPRLMVLLQLDGSAPQLPAPGTELKAGTRTVGRLGSIAHDYQEGPIALGLVKRSALSAGQLSAGEAAVLIDPSSLPAEENERAGRAAIDRLRGRG